MCFIDNWYGLIAYSFLHLILYDLFSQELFLLRKPYKSNLMFEIFSILSIKFFKIENHSEPHRSISGQ